MPQPAQVRGSAVATEPCVQWGRLGAKCASWCQRGRARVPLDVAHERSRRAIRLEIAPSWTHGMPDAWATSVAPSHSAWHNITWRGGYKRKGGGRLRAPRLLRPPKMYRHQNRLVGWKARESSLVRHRFSDGRDLLNPL